MGRHKADGLFCPFALHKARGYQLFDDGGAGGGRSQPLSFRFFRHIFLSGSLHSGKQRVLGEVLGRRGLALLYGGFGAIQYLPLRQLRQRGVLLFLREILLPAGIKDGFALGGELGAAALQRNCGFRIAVCIADRPEKLPCHKAQNLALAQRQDGGIRLARAGGRKDSVVVADLFTVADLSCVHTPRRVCFADNGGHGCKLRHGGFQIVGEEAAVRAGVGAELFLVEGLQVVKRLLCGVAEAAVGLPLERGQVVEPGRVLRLFRALHRPDRDRLTGAGGGEGVRSFFVPKLFGHGGKAAAAEAHGVKGFRAERPDLRLPLDDERQRRGQDAPYVEGAVVQHRKEPCGVDAHQPVRAGAAEGGLIQPVIFTPRTQLRKALFDGGVLHGGDPQPLHGLCAARHVVDGAEDKLPLAPRVAGVDDLGHVLPAHEVPQQLELFGFVRSQREAPACGQDGQIVIAPLGVLFIVHIRARQLRQMPIAPAHKVAASRKIAVVAFGRAQHGGDGLGDGGLFRDH